MKPEPKVINAEFAEHDTIPLLAGPPESVAMRSGAVQLQPGSTVGKHTNWMVYLITTPAGFVLLISSFAKVLRKKAVPPPLD